METLSSKYSLLTLKLSTGDKEWFLRGYFAPSIVNPWTSSPQAKKEK